MPCAQNCDILEAWHFLRGARNEEKETKMEKDIFTLALERARWLNKVGKKDTSDMKISLVSDEGRKLFHFAFYMVECNMFYLERAKSLPELQIQATLWLEAIKNAIVNVELMMENKPMPDVEIPDSAWGMAKCVSIDGAKFARLIERADKVFCRGFDRKLYFAIKAVNLVSCEGYKVVRSLYDQSVAA
jgi:hypothetical protein